MVVRCLRAELPGEPVSVQKRRYTHRRAPLSFGVGWSIQLCVGGRQNRPSRKLGVMSEITGEGTIHGFDALAVPVEEIIGRTEKKGRSRIGTIKAKSAFKPGQGLGGSARKQQNVTPRRKALGIARIDLEGMIDLSEGEVEAPPIHMYLGEQAVGGGRRGVQRQGFLRQRFGTSEVAGDKFCPSRRHCLDKRQT